MNGTEFELSKELWLECFEEDGKPFVDWYYSERTKPEYALGAFEAGAERPVSMLHIIPMHMRFCGKKRSVGFVAGVCTSPDRRRRGICGELFAHAFRIMRERGFDATVLQPFRTDFYARFGYSTYIVRNEARVSYDRLNRIVRPTERPPRIDPDPVKLEKLYRSAMKGYDGASIRGREYFESFIHEYSLPGAVLVTAENGCCAGYPESSGVFRATELFFRPEQDPFALLPEGYDEYVLPLPADRPVPEGCEAVSTEFSMLAPLKPGFRFGKRPLYGFDRY